MVRCYYIYPPSSEAIDYRSSPLLLRHPNPTNSQTGDGYQHNLKQGSRLTHGRFNVPHHRLLSRKSLVQHSRIPELMKLCKKSTVSL